MFVPTDKYDMAHIALAEFADAFIIVPATANIIGKIASGIGDDLLSTRIYAHYGLAEGLAMKIGGEGNPLEIRKKHWEKFAEEVGIKPRLVLTRVADLAQRIEVSRHQLFKGAFAPHKCDALYRLMELMGEQAEKTIRRLA